MFTPCTDKRVAVFFADGCEEIEGLSVVDVLYRAGIPCDKVSISDSLSVTSSHQVTFLTDKLLSQVSFGKKATSNPGFQHFLSENGANLSQDAVCVDGSFITSQGAGTALKFGLEIVRYLVGNNVAEKVSQGIVLI